MDDFGSITIDNRNLLDDLLGLGDEPGGQYRAPYSNINYNNNNYSSQLNYPSQQQLPQPSFQLQQQSQPSFQLQQQQTPKFSTNNPYADDQNSSNLKIGQKVYLESPTFEKEEDDMYRFVNSSLGNDVPNTARVFDSLNDTNLGYRNNNTQQPLSNYNNTENFNGNRPSDEAVHKKPLAPIQKNSFTLQQHKLPSDGVSNSHQNYQNDLLDSLDHNVNQNTLNYQQNNFSSSNNLLNNPANNFRIYNSNPNLQANASRDLYDSRQDLNQPAGAYHLDQQQQYYQQQPYVQYQQAQNPTLFQENLPQRLPGNLSSSQFNLNNNGNLSTEPFASHHNSLQYYNPPVFPNQQHLPFQQPQPLPSYRFQQSPQLIPQQQPILRSVSNQNMFYQEPLQQSIYNNNQYNQYQQPSNIQSNGTNYYNNQPSLDYENDSYNQYQDNAYYNNINTNSQGYAPQPAQRQNKPSSQLSMGNKYTAQPLQPPPNDDDYNDANNSTHDLSLLKTTLEKQPNLMIQQGANNSTNNGALSEEDLKRQQVWNKLQKANKDVKRRSDSRTKNGLPPVSNNLNASQTSVKSNQPGQTKRVIVVKPAVKPDNNHIERNVEIIRNKENLVHRYPEKKYEVVYGKNIEARIKAIHSNEATTTTNGKKPPHHLQPIDNMDDMDNQNIQKQISITDEIYANLDSSRKITIPLNSNMYRDKDHINVDINLKLSDFIPNNQFSNGNSYNNSNNNIQANSSSNRYYDDFEINNDPLSKHIRRFEGISRSLPGSSGSLNKAKPLPPVNKRMQNYYNQDSNRLQHEHEILNEPKSEEGYLARLQKEKNKPVIKTYTLKDYRNFKKDINPTTATNTGRLGFDFENENYKKTIEITEKKKDYAERVKERNKILIAEQKTNDSRSNSLIKNSAQSKSQRAKEYAKNNIIRPKSGSRPVSNEFPPSANDKSVVRVRDPITSKVKTVYLTDEQIEEQIVRHEKEKSKVNSFIKNSGKRPVNFNNGTTDIMASQHRTPIDFKNGPADIYTTNQPQKQQQALLIDQNKSKIIDQYREQQRTQESQKNLNVDDDDDDEFQKLMQRHNDEKQKVNTFEATVIKKASNINNGSNVQVNQSFKQDIIDQTIQNEIDQDNNEVYINDSTATNNNSSRIQLEDNLITT